MKNTFTISKSWITFLFVLLPAFSIWPSFGYFQITGKVVKFENFAREGLFLCAIILITSNYLQNGLLPNIFFKLRIWLLAVLAFAILAIAMNIPLGGIIRDTRDSATILISVIVGYYFCRYSSLRTALQVILFVSVPFVIIERIVTPVVLWRKLGFFEFLLENARISAGVTSADGFQGYYSESNIESVFLNYDKLLAGGDIIFRCGSILGSPIVFGHFLSGITCFFWFDYITKKRSLSIIPFIVSLFVGLVLVRTKGYATSILFFLGLWVWDTKPKIRLLLLLLGITGSVYYLSHAFSNKLTAAQHILIFYDYWQLSLKAPIFGSGVGSGLYDDSFLGRLLVEGGLVLSSAFIVFVLKLSMDISKSSQNGIQKNFILACAFPLLFTSAGTSFVSIYIFGLIIGCFLGEGNAFSNMPNGADRDQKH